MGYRILRSSLRDTGYSQKIVTYQMFDEKRSWITKYMPFSVFLNIFNIFNGSSGCCEVYPGRSNISRSLFSFRMVQYIFEKWAETPSRGAFGCCSNIPIPDLKKDILYNLMAMIGNGTIKT